MKKIIIIIIMSMFMLQNVSYAQEEIDAEQVTLNNQIMTYFIIFSIGYITGQTSQLNKESNLMDNETVEEKRFETYMSLDNNEYKTGIKFKF